MDCATKSLSSEKGFTLIELVIVIIVLGVLAAIAVPKFIGKSSFEDYTVQDQLIARLRLVQLQNMNADPSVNASSNACYWVVVTADCFYNDHTIRNSSGDCTSPATRSICQDDSFNEFNRISYSSNMLSPDSYLFDLQGKLIAGGDTIAINGDNGLSIGINSEGYIHE